MATKVHGNACSVMLILNHPIGTASEHGGPCRSIGLASAVRSSNLGTGFLGQHLESGQLVVPAVLLSLLCWTVSITPSSELTAGVWYFRHAAADRFYTRPNNPETCGDTDSGRRICILSLADIRGRPSCLPSALALLRPARTRSFTHARPAW